MVFPLSTRSVVTRLLARRLFRVVQRDATLRRLLAQQRIGWQREFPRVCYWCGAGVPASHPTRIGERSILNHERPDDGHRCLLDWTPTNKVPEHELEGPPLAKPRHPASGDTLEFRRYMDLKVRTQALLFGRTENVRFEAGDTVEVTKVDHRGIAFEVRERDRYRNEIVKYKGIISMVEFYEAAVVIRGLRRNLG